MSGNKARLYKLTADFEALVGYYACAGKSLFGKLGTDLDSEGFKNETVKLIIDTASAMRLQHGHGPSSPKTLLQRLRTMEEAGKVTNEQRLEVRDFLLSFDGAPDVPEQDVIDELTPILKHRMRRDALEAGFQDLVKSGDLDATEQTLQRAKRLGVSNTTIGTRLGPSAFDAIRRLSKLQKIEIGVEEVDLELKGGLREKQLLVFVGGFGSGKSFALAHAAAHAMTKQIGVAIATLELSEEEQFSRLVANLVGIPIDDILDDMLDDAQKRMKKLQKADRLGFCTIKFFSPGTTTVSDIKEWLKAEVAAGAPIQALYTDYADKLISGEKMQSGYDAMKHVYEGLRNIAVDTELPIRWSLTASQAKTEAVAKGKTKILEGHHVSDSQHKARIADVMITLNRRDDGTQMIYNIAKNRTGRGSQTVGPLPCDFELGRVGPVYRDGWPYE